MSSQQFPVLVQSLSQLLVKILMETGLFEKHESEIEIWLKRINPSNNQFFQTCLVSVAQEPQKYVDKFIWFLQQNKEIEFFPSSGLRGENELFINGKHKLL